MACYFLTVFLSSYLSLPSVSPLSSDCSDATCTPFSTLEKQNILDLHNELRDRVAGGGLSGAGHPPATGMNSLIWDTGLQNVAQSYAETCPGLSHNSHAGITYLAQRNTGTVKWGTDSQKLSNFCSGQDCIPVGENIAVFSGAYTVATILSQIETGWFDEYRYWTFGSHNSGCQSGAMCGHYTQLIWANTRYIGCGYANGCSSGGWAALFVCNYWPAGNFNSVAPYEAGSSCSSCMTDRTQCQSDYMSQSKTAATYPLQPYHALCGGGACPTMCDGGSFSRNTCDGLGCDGSNVDCNDGTISRSNGREICDVLTAVPTTAPNTAATAIPTTETDVGTATPPTVYKECCHGDCMNAQYDVVGCAVDTQCEMEICAADSFCCDTEWDGICASNATTICISTPNVTSNPSRNASIAPTKSGALNPSKKATYTPTKTPIQTFPSNVPTNSPIITPTVSPTQKPTSTTITNRIKASVDSDQYGILDFAGYELIDWVLCGAIVLFVIAMVSSLMCCIRKVKSKNAVRLKSKFSKMRVRTGINRAEVLAIGIDTQSQKYDRVQAAVRVVSFGGNGEYKENTLAFDAALFGVALAKGGSNVDLVAGNVMQTHILADESPQTDAVECNDSELMALSDGLLDSGDCGSAAAAEKERDDYAVVNSIVDAYDGYECGEYEYEYEYEEYDEVEKAPPVPVAVPAIPPPVARDAFNNTPVAVQQPVAEVTFLAIEEAKKQKGVDKEKYLNDEDFKSVFEISKDEFSGLAGWKQKNLKKAKGFF